MLNTLYFKGNTFRYIKDNKVFFAKNKINVGYTKNEKLEFNFRSNGKKSAKALVKKNTIIR